MGANTQNYDEQGGASQIIGGTQTITGTQTISGTQDLTGTAKKHGVDVSEQQTFTKYYRATIAEVNATGGTELLPAITGKKYRITDFTIRAIGGAAGAVTTVDIEDGADTPVSIFTAAQANLTENTILKPGDTGITVSDGYLIGTTAAKNVVVTKTGSDVTTATHFDIVLEYQIIDG